MKKIVALATEEPTSVQQFRDDVPDALSRILHDMLAKDLDQRPTSAEKVAIALEPFAKDADLGKLFSMKDRATETNVVLAPTEEVQKVQRSESKTRFGSWSRFGAGIAVVLLLLVAAFFGPQITRYVSNQGVLVIETDSSDIEVVLKDGTGKIIDAKSKRRITLTANDYEIEVQVKDKSERGSQTHSVFARQKMAGVLRSGGAQHY